MLAAIRAGSAYYLIVFVIGFALGAVRVLVVAPRFGDMNAVLIELPIMLALSWIACTWAARRFAVPPDVPARLTMGTLAFALLMLSELALSVFALGRTPGERLAVYGTLGAQMGLAAQLAFALFPLLQMLRRSAR